MENQEIPKYNLKEGLENESKLREEARRKGSSIPIVQSVNDEQIVYGTIDPKGIIKGKLYEKGQNPEDGPIGNYSNVRWSQHDDR